MADCISIIVPIYNSSKTLDRCIKSILCQTYKNIELLLVNDGSTDDSEKICLKYQALDNRVKYFYKENTGTGDTRNYGIIKSKGSYIGFVDSDDEVLPNMYEKLINVNKSIKYDIIGCSNYDYFEETNIKKERTLDLKEGIQNNRIVIDILYQNKNAWGAVWNKIFKREIFNDISFIKTSTLEDYSVTLKVFNEYSVYFIKEVLYIHYINSTSLSHRVYNEKMLLGYNVVNDITNYFKLKKSPKKILNGCIYFKLSLSEFICRSIWKDKKNNNFKVLKKIKKQESIKNVFKCKSLSAFKLYLKINMYYFLMLFRRRNT